MLTGNVRPEKEGIAYKRYFRLNGDSLFLRNTDHPERRVWLV